MDPTQVTAENPAKQKLQDAIDETFNLLQSKPFTDLQTTITEDVDRCLYHITEVPPQNIGDLIAHFHEIGRLRAFREIQQRPKDLLNDLKQQLKELE